MGRLSQFSYALRELRKSTNEECALIAYHSHAAAWIRYGIVLWGNGTDVEAVLILQKRCLRIITRTSREQSCRSLFPKFNILTVRCLYIFELCRLVRRHPDCFQKISDVPSRYTSRRGNNLVVPSARLELCRRGAYCMAVKVYNHLPNQLKTLQGIKFENGLKSFLMGKTYYTMKEYFDDKF